MYWARLQIKCDWKGAHLYDMTIAGSVWVWKARLNCDPTYHAQCTAREHYKVMSACDWGPTIWKPMLIPHRLLFDSLNVLSWTRAIIVLVYQDSHPYCMSQARLSTQHLTVDVFRNSKQPHIWNVYRLHVMVLYYLEYIQNVWQCILKCLLITIFVHNK